jgi:hypothetical protein
MIPILGSLLMAFVSGAIFLATVSLGRDKRKVL